MYNKIKRIIVFFIVLLFVTAAAGGCQKSNTEIVFTTGLGKKDVFKIGKEICTLPEAMVFVTTLQNQYQNTYGVDMWNQDFGGVTLEAYVKKMIVSQLAQIKSMKLLAESKGIELTDQDKKAAADAGTEYFKSLGQDEVNDMGVNQEVIHRMYEEFALANKVYARLTEGVNPEVSDDEARIVTVRHILVKTYSIDADGVKTEFAEKQKDQALKTVLDIAGRARGGEDFGALAETYNEDEKSDYKFSRGEMDQAFEDAAFSLEDNQISDVVETQYGFHVIQCLNKFDREATDANKVVIAERRKEDAFNKIYDAYVAGLPSEFNDKLWDSVKFKADNLNKTMNFFDIYNKYFPT